MATEQEVLSLLRKVYDPELNRNLVDLGMVDQIKIQPDGLVQFTIKLTTLACPMKNRMADEARRLILTLPGVKQVEIEYAAMSKEEIRVISSQTEKPLPPIKQFNQIECVLAVMSGKGGVGKSSVTAMTAAELVRRGYKVGILDADVTGPSIPKLFGLPPGGLRGGELGMLPAVTMNGIRVVSTNLLLPSEDMPTIWRGPRIAAMINQFWNDTIWGRLDYLLVDLPPGTSDAALTVMQKLPLQGIVLVTSPQELSAVVVSKAVHMAEKMGFPILALVENLSYFRCPDNGKKYAIFGKSHVDEIANSSEIKTLIRLPVDPGIAEMCDAGQAAEIELDEVKILVDRLLEQI